VNAILRRIIRDRPALTYTDDIDWISVETSHPRWLIEKWLCDFGPEMTKQIAAANNEVPVYAFRSLDGGPVQVAAAKPSEFVEGCYLIDRIDSDPAIFADANGLYFQDEGSQMVAATVRVPQGGRFLDVCAAPGGKTGFIAHRSGADFVVAGDLHHQRVLMLLDNCRRQAANVQLVQYDAEKSLPFEEASFDAVLVDAPCSGTGTIRHNPEIRYFLQPSDITDLATEQLAILKNASKLVTHEGSLVYSTCSFEIEENESVCAAFLGAVSQFSQIKPNVPEGFLTPDGFARTFPHRDAMDGFFIAEFRRH
jgi:16S rRNA (cytosine967-C5)-methyltransferase